MFAAAIRRRRRERAEVAFPALIGAIAHSFRRPLSTGRLRQHSSARAARARRSTARTRQRGSFLFFVTSASRKSDLMRRVSARAPRAPRPPARSKERRLKERERLLKLAAPRKAAFRVNRVYKQAFN
ncbi:hypothetical protein EVAR_103308_1 [Eumeta japonica]|uniref:Uncharacterized protein n=1 Tax=Eumeta variegata TaxID=151549 RepID=A0A4C1XNB7_EUMVA|nr:hypothetical protein EVAR_103308_1 [Eumeta japonica]